jgi:hypothetical protein
VAELMLSMCEALSSIPSNTKKQNRIKINIKSTTKKIKKKTNQ